MRVSPLHVLNRGLATLLVAIPAFSYAADKTWDGGGNPDFNWLTPANWNGDTAPSAGDGLIFAGSTGLTNTNNFASGTLFNNISFATGAGNYVLGGNIITLGGNIVTVSNTQTINTGLVLNGNHTFSVSSSTLVMGGTFGGSGNVTKSGANTATFVGGANASYVGNNYSGNVSLTAGTLSFTTGVHALAWVTTGSFNSGSGTTLSLPSGDVSFGGLSGNGTINVGNRRVVISTDNAATQVFTGTVTNTTNFQGFFGKFGTGTLDMSGGSVSINSTVNNYWGTLIMKGNTGNGGVLVNGGTMKLTATSGVVTGGNNAGATFRVETTLSGGTLWIAPSGSGADVVVTGGSAVTTGTSEPNQLFNAYGGRLLLDRGLNNSLTYAFGNPANNAGGGLQLSTGGGLILAASHGLNALGTTEKFVMVGTNATYVPVTNGIADARLFGQDARSMGAGGDGLMTGTFLTYSGSGLATDPGFKSFDWSDTVTNPNANKNFSDLTNNTTVEYVEAGQTINLTASTTNVFALRNDGIINNTGTLTIGNGLTTTAAGLILNGGTINGGSLAVGNTTSSGIGAIYTSRANGTIASTLTGSGNLSIMGPGVLNYKGGASTVKTYINTDSTFDTSEATGTYSGAITLQGGVYQSKGTLNKALASGGVIFGTSGGGFAARGGALSVNLNSSRALVWGNGSQGDAPFAGTSNFLNEGPLVFGSTTADNTVTLQNSIDLGGNGLSSSRIIQVIDNASSSTDKAVLAGNITSRSPNNRLVKDGGGVLELAGQNKFEGDTIIASGTLRAASSTALSTGANNTIVQNGATLDLNGQTLANGKTITLNGTGVGGTGSLINNSNTDATLGDGISLSVVSSSGTWTSLPTISITGGDGTGASATVDGFMMSAITVLSAGSGYTNATVAISGQTSGPTATATVTTSSGAVSRPLLDASAAALFTSTPVLTVTGGSGTGASLSSSLILNLAGISLTAGSGYTVAPEVTLTGGGGTAVLKAEVGSVVLESTSSVGGSGNLNIKPVVSGTGGLTKIGTGTLTLGAQNTYTGATVVSAGTLVVDGSIASSSGVTVQSGARLGGHGSVGQISGSGQVGPGNSPGILTATSADPSGGLDFAFEFTLANAAPIYANPANSANDVLRLTSATPFTASLNSSNTIAVYLNVSSISLGESFTGGFYVDTGDFFSSISGASFAYYIADAGGFFTYGGQTYSLYTGSMTISTLAQTANFGTGNVNGYVTQFEAVPEPTTWLLIGLGFGVLLFSRRRHSHA